MEHQARSSEGWACWGSQAPRGGPSWGHWLRPVQPACPTPPDGPQGTMYPTHRRLADGKERTGETPHRAHLGSRKGRGGSLGRRAKRAGEGREWQSALPHLPAYLLVHGPAGIQGLHQAQARHTPGALLQETSGPERSVSPEPLLLPATPPPTLGCIKQDWSGGSLPRAARRPLPSTQPLRPRPAWLCPVLELVWINRPRPASKVLKVGPRRLA